MCEICHSAVVAEPEDPYFCCTTCGSGRSWRRVIFPREDLRREIETVLLLRPGFRHSAPVRNWNRSESIDDLRRQNIEAGDPVDRRPEPPEHSAAEYAIEHSIDYVLTEEMEAISPDDVGGISEVIA